MKRVSNSRSSQNLEGLMLAAGGSTTCYKRIGNIIAPKIDNNKNQVYVMNILHILTTD